MKKKNNPESSVKYDAVGFLGAVQQATSQMPADLGQLVRAATEVKVIEQRFPGAPVEPLYLALGVMGYKFVPDEHKMTHAKNLYEKVESLVGARREEY